jgi:hypothetical protein
LVLGLVACGGPTETGQTETGPTPGGPTAPAVTSTPAAPTGESSSSLPPASEQAPSAAPSGPADGGIVVDGGLLDVLPPAIDGFSMMPDPETAADIAGDPATDRGVERLAVALYLDPSDQVESDFAIISVAGLRPGVFSAEWFRGWRDTYNEAACDIAGGLAPGSAETEIAGHRTFIGTCVQGVHTYHVHLADPDRVLAITALGSGRYGERVVAGLTE